MSRKIVTLLLFVFFVFIPLQEIEAQVGGEGAQVSCIEYTDERVFSEPLCTSDEVPESIQEAFCDRGESREVLFREGCLKLDVVGESCNDFQNIPDINEVLRCIALESGAEYCCTADLDNIVTTGSGDGGDEGDPTDSEEEYDADSVRENVDCDNKEIEEGIESRMVSSRSYLPPNTCLALSDSLVDCETTHDKCEIFGNYYCCNKDLGVPATDSNKGCNGTGEDYQKCMACMYEIGEGPADRNTDYEATGAVWTSLGCIDPSPSGIITRLYQIGIGIVGGLILVIKVPQIVIAYNSGDPEKIQEAQNGVWSIAGGLLLLIFATAVLEALGVHVIGLPSGFI
ncbi:hypothetical protein GF389_03525 [Candidatus Dojkabacteria bacterium]|nr:hypothetical protein [Candidatus Dojkabacteria bacterium]